MLVVLLVLMIGPGWTGYERLPLLDADSGMTVRPYVPDGGWPRRVGLLEPVGGLVLSGDAPAFGGFSAMVVRNGRATLLSDGGNIVSFAIRRGEVRDLRAGFLPGGPGTGWRKWDRDSESLAVDPATGRLWVGFERANAIWRYAPGFTRAEAWQRPAEMRRWSTNSGPESLVRFADGSFLTIAERASRKRPREAVLFAGDPAEAGTRAVRFSYRPPTGYDPSDAVELPGGDVLVLNRRYRPPLRFAAKLALVPRAAIRADAVVTGREVATLRWPVLGENAEGLAVTRERGRTMLWIVTDNDSMWLRRTLLLKFRLHETAEARR